LSLVAIALIAGGCRKKNDVAANLNAQNKVAVRPIRLYYESEAMLLVPEARNVALPESPAGAIPMVVRELIKGPVLPASLRLFPPDTVVRGAYLLPEGTVIVDLGGPTLTSGWGAGSHTELMAIYSLVHTVTSNFTEARRVRIVVNGTPADTLGGHISLARSLGPMPTLIDARHR
jgi:hypothetical protein